MNEPKPEILKAMMPDMHFAGYYALMIMNGLSQWGHAQQISHDFVTTGRRVLMFTPNAEKIQYRITIEPIYGDDK
jgi:hypothetical protein